MRRVYDVTPFVPVVSDLDNLTSVTVEDAFYIWFGKTILISMSLKIVPLVVDSMTPCVFSTTIPFPVDTSPDIFSFNQFGRLWSTGTDATFAAMGNVLRITLSSANSNPEKRTIGLAYRTP